MIIEKDIEKYFVKRAYSVGADTFKFVSPGNAGVPDRIVILKDGTVFFVELKTKTGKLSAMQRVQLERLEKHGANVFVAYGIAGVDYFFDVTAANR